MVRATLLLLATVAGAVGTGLYAQEGEVAQFLSARDSALAPVRRALAADSAVRRGAATESRFVLIERGEDGRLIVGASYLDRQALHWAGRAQGRYVMSGWFRAGEVSGARVYYYVVGTPAARPEPQRLVPLH